MPTSSDVAARQNHAIFGRRGCGKSLLLHYSAKILPPEIKSVYLNCEDFKKHSFPNVLIEILDALFGELEKNLTGWFGRKKKSRGLISDIRSGSPPCVRPGYEGDQIRQTDAVENKEEQKSGFGVELKPANLSLSNSLSQSNKREIEQRYKLSEDKSAH